MEAAAGFYPNDLLIGRRQANRHRLNMAARLIAAHQNMRVQLEDISASGACIRLMRPGSLHDGHLCWLNFRAFARVVWRSDLRYGLRFDEPLSDDCLRRTAEFDELIGEGAGDKYGRLASAWVHGPGDW